MSIRSCQFIPFYSSVSIHGFQFLHVKSFMSVDSCQFIHFMHFISFQFASFQFTMNSFKPCPARAGHRLVWHTGSVYNVGLKWGNVFKKKRSATESICWATGWGFTQWWQKTGVGDVLPDGLKHSGAGSREKWRISPANWVAPSDKSMPQGLGNHGKSVALGCWESACWMNWMNSGELQATQQAKRWISLAQAIKSKKQGQWRGPEKFLPKPLGESRLVWKDPQPEGLSMFE